MKDDMETNSMNELFGKYEDEEEEEIIHWRPVAKKDNINIIKILKEKER